jgi:CPA1 family monovalent cation:H+ antiporter
MVFGNVKGALSMAAVLALPLDLPHRDRLVTLVFGITLVTLVTQGLPFARLLRLLGVAAPAGDTLVDRAWAALISAKRGQRELDGLLDEGLLSRFEHASRRAKLQRTVIEAEKVLLTNEAKSSRDRLVEATVLHAQKAALKDAERRGLVSSGDAELEIEELDRRLAKARAQSEEEP